MSALRADPARRPAATPRARNDRRRGWLAFAAALAASATLHAAVLLVLSGREREAAGTMTAALEVVSLPAPVAAPPAAMPAGDARDAATAHATRAAEPGPGGDAATQPSSVQEVLAQPPMPVRGAETWLSMPPAPDAAAPADAASLSRQDAFAAFATPAATAADREPAEPPLPAVAAALSAPADVDGAPGPQASAAPLPQEPPAPEPPEPPAPAAAASGTLRAAVADQRQAPAASAPLRAPPARRQGPRAASPAESPPQREDRWRGGDVAEASSGTARGAELASRPPAGQQDAPAEPVAGNPPPAYPAAARRAGREGRAVLRVVVSRTGEGRDVRIAESSGTASLDEAALAAVRLWRFAPARRNGEVAEDVVLVPVSFRLLQ